MNQIKALFVCVGLLTGSTAMAASCPDLSGQWVGSCQSNLGDQHLAKSEGESLKSLTVLQPQTIGEVCKFIFFNDRPYFDEGIRVSQSLAQDGFGLVVSTETSEWVGDQFVIKSAGTTELSDTKVDFTATETFSLVEGNLIQSTETTVGETKHHSECRYTK